MRFVLQRSVVKKCIDYNYFLFTWFLQILSGEIKLTFPIMFNPVTWDAHAFPVFFGGTQLSADRNIISVPSIQMVYFATAGTKKQDAR